MIKKNILENEGLKNRIPGSFNSIQFNFIMFIMHTKNGRSTDNSSPTLVLVPCFDIAYLSYHTTSHMKFH